MYPQLDLEAATIDFALRQFRNYRVGAKEVKITGHKPVCSVFKTHRQGSIRTDINYYVEYQQGKVNESDYLSRHGKSFSTLPENEQMEADELHHLPHTLHAN